MRAMPDGAVLLAVDNVGQVYAMGANLVVERLAPDGKLVRVRLPAGDLDWVPMALTALRAASAGHVWQWKELLEAGCDALAARQLQGS